MRNLKYAAEGTVSIPSPSSPVVEGKQGTLELFLQSGVLHWGPQGGHGESPATGVPISGVAGKKGFRGHGMGRGVRGASVARGAVLVLWTQSVPSRP